MLGWPVFCACEYVNMCVSNLTKGDYTSTKIDLNFLLNVYEVVLCNSSGCDQIRGGCWALV